MAVQIEVQLKNVDIIKSFLKERPEVTKKNLNRAIAKTVADVERETKRRAPVDTGRMRASVRRREFTSRVEGEVGVHVNYAIYVHEGTNRMRPRPFMRQAVNYLENRIQNYFIDAISASLK